MTNMKTSSGLVAVIIVLAVLVPQLIASADAAPTPDIGISLEKRDWIDEGLDKYYEAIDSTKGVSIPIYKDVGIRFGNTYTTEERTNFVIGLIAAGFLGLMIISCLFRCLFGRRG